MPIYLYECVDCRCHDERIAALDDHVAICVRCGGMMLRRDLDVFEPYFVDPSPVAQW